MSRLPVAALVKFLSLAVVVALATTVLAVTIANASGGDRATYTARFTDAAGLLASDDVRIAGVVVGAVERVRIVDRRVAEVEFTVDRAQRLPASVTAAINYENLIGQRYLELEQGGGAEGSLEPGATIPEDRTRGPLNLTTLFNGFQPLFTALDAEQVNQLSFEIIEVLQGQGGTIESLLASTASLTSTIADRDEVIGQVIDNLNSVLDTVNARDEQLSALIVSLQELVSGLAEDREPIGEALASIGELTEVTAGFVSDARPALADDVVALGDLSDNLVASGGTIESFLQNWSPKLRKLSRAGSYGSWFNFYLCGVGGQVGLSPFVEPVQLDLYRNAADRCGADPDAGAGGPDGTDPKAAGPGPAPVAGPDDLAGLPLVGGLLEDGS
jgi:phospholipid/cholesterol/gamma-HCH transport system substrate-binding protein